MKGVLYVSGSLVLIALAAFIHDLTMKARIPSIVAVAIHDDEMGEDIEFGTVTGQTGKGGDGPASWTSLLGSGRIDESFKVISSDPTHSTVRVHFVMTKAGVSTPVDLTLPVWDKKPDLAWWDNLDSHFKTAAYRSAPSIML